MRNLITALGRNVIVCQYVVKCFIVLDIWTQSKGQAAGTVTQKLVKNPLPLFHATLSAQLRAFNWERAGETDSDSETPCVAEPQDHHNNPHLKYTDTERNAGVSKCLPPPQKDPTRKCSREKCLTCTVKISHNEKLGAQFNFFLNMSKGSETLHI